MRKQTKKWLLSALAVCSLGVISVGVTTFSGVADGTQAETFVMENGASVRLTANSTGIRFMAKTSVVDENATYNFVIAPTYYFEAVQGTTAVNEADWVALFNANEKIGEDGYIHLTNITPANADEDAAIEIRGSVEKIKFNNMNLSYTGIAYKQDKTTGVRDYADVESLENISRSVARVSSAALNSGDYTNNLEATTIMNEFIKKAFVKEAGYKEMVDGETITYAKDQENLSLDDAFAAIDNKVTISVEENQKLLHKYDITVNSSVDLAYNVKSNGFAYADGKIQSLTTEVEAFTLTVGDLLTATAEIAVDEVTKLTATSDTIIDATKMTVVAGTGLDLSAAIAAYDVSDAPVDLGYAAGKITTSYKFGERTVAVLTENDTFYIDVVVADCVIYNFADLRYYYTGSADTAKLGAHTVEKNASEAMYAILANDIANPIGSWWTYGLDRSIVSPQGSVFDGRGFKIDKAYMLRGWFGNTQTKNATLKNLTVDYIYTHTCGVFGNTLESCLIENVNFTHSGTASGWYTNNYSGGQVIAVYVKGDGLIIKNSTITILNDNKMLAPIPLTHGKNAGITLENVIIKSENGGSIVFDDGESLGEEIGTSHNGTVVYGVITEGSTFLIEDETGKYGPLAPVEPDKPAEAPTPTESLEKNVNTEYISVVNNVLKLADISVDITAENVSKIWVNGEETAFTNNNDGTVTFVENVAGENTLLVSTTDGKAIAMKAAFADYVIGDANVANNVQAYKDWATCGKTFSYVVLAGNVTSTASNASGYGSLSAGTNAGGTQLAVGGTFNGLGHTLTNCYFNLGMFGDSYLDQVTIKNFTLDWALYMDRGVFGTFGTGTVSIENVKSDMIEFIGQYSKRYNDMTALVASGTRGGATVTMTNCDLAFYASTDTMLKLMSNESTLKLVNTNISTSVTYVANGKVNTANQGLIAYKVGDVGYGQGGAVTETSLVMDANSSVKDQRG